MKNQMIRKQLWLVLICDEVAK